MKLFPHQEAALKDTEGQNRVAYYLDMGLGKTFLGAEKAVRIVIADTSKSTKHGHSSDVCPGVRHTSVSDTDT